jgi:opacity protein-like surface antigen
MKNVLRALVITAAAISFFSTAAAPAAAQSIGRLQAGIDYSYLRANAPPAGCPCFSANGGDGWLGYNVNSKFTVLGEVASQRSSNINNTGADLTLTSFLAGPRYSYRHAGRFVPFGEVLLGAAHAGGSLSPSNSGFSDSSYAFAMATGGGLDVVMTKRISVRAVRADYYLTTFANGVNDHQNNLRISAGVVLRLR